MSVQDKPSPPGGNDFPDRFPGPPVSPTRARLLELDRGARVLELALAFSASSFDAFSSDRLGGAVDEVLGLFQAQARQLAHDLDHLDLLVAGRVEDDVELVLLLGGLGRAGARAGGGRDGDRARR